MNPTEAYVLELIENQWGVRNLTQIGLKLGGESGEVQEAITKIAEGRAGQLDLEAEIGDVMMVLASIVEKTGAPSLEHLYGRRVAEKRAEWERLAHIREAEMRKRPISSGYDANVCRITGVRWLVRAAAGRVIEHKNREEAEDFCKRMQWSFLTIT